MLIKQIYGITSEGVKYNNKKLLKLLDMEDSQT
jgi:hypothetical protein